jgi:hypothetical protein
MIPARPQLIFDNLKLFACLNAFSTGGLS